MKHMLRLILLLSAVNLIAADSPLRPVALQCQHDPTLLGVDISHPELSWKLEAEGYGRKQTAYQIQVASEVEELEVGQADLWDTGKLQSDETLNLPYAGKLLASSQQVFWRVKVWDEAGRESPWSAPASWTMGLLFTNDWQGARWITGAELLRYQRHALGYRSRDATNRDTVKWVQLDLGVEHPVDDVMLRAVRYMVSERLGFPRGFKVELAREADFSDARVIADYSTNNYRNAWATRIELKGDGKPARYVRIIANHLRDSDGVICLAFSQIEVISKGRNVAPGSLVTTSDSIEQAPWSAASVVDGLEVRGANPLANSTLLVRRDFTVLPKLRRAVLHVCGLGQYELSVNGRRVGDALLMPAWSQYDRTCYYDTYDVSSFLESGKNALGFTLAGGFYNVQPASYTKYTTQFRPLMAIALLRLEYADGTVKTIVTDDHWQAARGPATFCNEYAGERYDARREPDGWNRPGFDASQWRAAVTTEGPGGIMRGAAYSSPPIGVHGVLEPVATLTTPSGATTYDLGQNAALMVRLRVRGPAGSQVKLIPAELVRSDGSVDRESVGGGDVSWTYTLAGKPRSETWQSQFFYHGARYLEVRLSPAAMGGEVPVVEKLEGLIVHSDSPSAGEFSCSKELFNRMRKLIRWAQLSNMQHVLTDCPHRERLGWLEQYHLHGPSLRYEWDLDRLYRKSIQDMEDAQAPNGLVPEIAPEYVIFSGDFRDSPEWGGASVLVPWQQYQWTGNLEPLRDAYEMMQRYVAYLGTAATDHIVDQGLGDWYDLGPNPPGYAQLTPKALTATAFYYRDTTVVAKIAELLGRNNEAEQYRKLAGEIRAAFNAKFYDEGKGSYATGSQTANAIPLAMGIVEATNRASVLDALVKDVRAHDHTLTTGDIGHRYLLRALADGGRSDVVYDIHSQTNKPGYGYILNQGATSLTEAWNARRGSSQNHFMLGHITEWFYHDLAGIQPDPEHPGFKHIIIRPSLVGDLTRAKATYNSVRGEISSEWHRKDGRMTLQVNIPPNTSATVFLPGTNAKVVVPKADRPKAAAVLRGDQLKGVTVFKVASGHYAFEADAR